MTRRDSARPREAGLGTGWLLPPALGPWVRAPRSAPGPAEGSAGGRRRAVRGGDEQGPCRTQARARRHARSRTPKAPRTHPAARGGPGRMHPARAPSEHGDTLHPTLLRRHTHAQTQGDWGRTWGAAERTAAPFIRFRRRKLSQRDHHERQHHAGGQQGGDDDGGDGAGPQRACGGRKEGAGSARGPPPPPSHSPPPSFLPGSTPPLYPPLPALRPALMSCVSQSASAPTSPPAPPSTCFLSPTSCPQALASTPSSWLRPYLRCLPPILVPGLPTCTRTPASWPRPRPRPAPPYPPGLPLDSCTLHPAPCLCSRPQPSHSLPPRRPPLLSPSPISTPTSAPPPPAPWPGSHCPFLLPPIPHPRPAHCAPRPAPPPLTPSVSCLRPAFSIRPQPYPALVQALLGGAVLGGLAWRVRGWAADCRLPGGAGASTGSSSDGSSGGPVPQGGRWLPAGPRAARPRTGCGEPGGRSDETSPLLSDWEGVPAVLCRRPWGVHSVALDPHWGQGCLPPRTGQANVGGATHRRKLGRTGAHRELQGSRDRSGEQQPGHDAPQQGSVTPAELPGPSLGQGDTWRGPPTQGSLRFREVAPRTGKQCPVQRPGTCPPCRGSRPGR